MAAAIPCRSWSILLRRRAAKSVPPLGPLAPTLTQRQLEPGLGILKLNGAKVKTIQLSVAVLAISGSRACPQDSPAEGDILISLDLARRICQLSVSVPLEDEVVELEKQRREVGLLISSEKVA